MMGPATGVIGAGLRAVLARRMARLGDTAWWRAHTAGVQRAQLRRLLRSAGGTSFGRSHGFARLATLPDGELEPAYRRAVPAADYEGFRAAFAEMREEGRPDVLWPGVVRHFAQTSGTTAGDKFIPVSREMLRSNFRASLDIFAHAARNGLSLARIFGGRILFLGGSTDLTVNAHGIATGDLSGIVTPLIRWPLTEIYLPGKRIALMSHWPSKIEAMARASLDADVRMMTGMPSWGLVLMRRVLELAREAGRPARTIRDVWPRFEALVHGGVKYGPFEGQVRALYSGSPDGADVPFRLELYPASEGFIAIQDTRHDPGLRLLTDIGIYFEFLPLERVHEPDPPAFAAHEVEKGQRYVVCLTTCAGLWRYIIGDVVEFDTVPAGARGGGDGPARLRIVGRHRHFVNAFGENLIVEHIENAVAAAARATGIATGEFTAAPVYPGPGRGAGLELLIEVPPGAGDLGAFTAAFDAELKRQNVDYTTKRTDGVGMVAPTVTPVAPGTFHRWLESRGKLGGQHKCPRCANGRETLESVARLAAPAVTPGVPRHPIGAGG